MPKVLKVCPVSSTKIVGANVNTKNQEGYTALMLAAEAGHTNIVEQLLAGKADPGLRNHKRLQAVTLAREAGHEEVARLLDARDGAEFWLLKAF